MWVRVEAATLLSYLTEVDVELQRTAAMTDQLIILMWDYFEFEVGNKVYFDCPRFFSPFVSGKMSVLILERTEHARFRLK